MFVIQKIKMFSLTSKFARPQRNLIFSQKICRFSSLTAPNNSWPAFLTKEKGAAVDIIVAESNDILFNLATEEFIFEHVDVANPILFLWRNSPTIIIGKHQNPWKECHV